MRLLLICGSLIQSVNTSNLEDVAMVFCYFCTLVHVVSFRFVSVVGIHKASSVIEH